MLNSITWKVWNGKLSLMRLLRSSAFRANGHMYSQRDAALTVVPEHEPEPQAGQGTPGA